MRFFTFSLLFTISIFAQARLDVNESKGNDVPNLTSSRLMESSSHRGDGLTVSLVTQLAMYTPTDMPYNLNELFVTLIDTKEAKPKVPKAKAFRLTYTGMHPTNVVLNQLDVEKFELSFDIQEFIWTQNFGEKHKFMPAKVKIKIHTSSKNLPTVELLQ